MTGKCENKWCERNDQELRVSFRDDIFAMFLCVDCFGLFGYDLPDDKVVERVTKANRKKKGVKGGKGNG
jgi:hypothetical protein